METVVNEQGEDGPAAGFPSNPGAGDEAGLPWASRLVAAGLVLTPFLAKPLALLHSSWASRRFDVRAPWAALATFLLLLHLARLFLRGGRSRFRRGGVIAAGIWGLTLIGTSFLSEFRPLSPAAAANGLALLGTALAASLLGTEDDSKIRYGWTVAACVMAAGAILQKLGGGDPWGTIGNRNYLAGYLAASVPIVLAGSKGRWRIGIPGTALLIAGIVVAGSRGAFLALAVVLFGWGVFRLRNRRLRTATILAAIGLTLALAFSAPGRRAIGRLAEEDVRPAIWPSALRAAADRPLFGWGPGSFRVVFPLYRTENYRRRPHAVNATQHAHNEPLEYLVESGIVGSAAWIGLLGYAAVGWRRQGRRVAPYGLALCVFLLHGLVDVNLRYPPNGFLFWALTGRLWGADRGIARRRIVRNPAVAVLLTAAAAAWFAGAVACPWVSDLRVRRAHLRRDRGDWQGAGRAYEAALRANPFNDRTWYELAYACTRPPARWDRAETAYRRAAELAPHHADVDHNLGVLYLVTKRPADAIAWFEEAVRVGPDPLRDRCWLGRARLAAGDVSGAEREVRALLEVRPDDPCGRSLQAAVAEAGRGAERNARP